MAPFCRTVLALFVVQGSVCPVIAQDHPATKWTPTQIEHWHYLIEELDISELHNRFSQEHKRSDISIQNVSVIPMDREIVLEEQTVFIKEEHIEAIRAKDNLASADSTIILDGTGKYLIPGLTDSSGFFDESHMYKSFKKELRQTPRQFANVPTNVGRMKGTA